MSKLCTVEVHHGEVVQREHVSSICGERQVVNSLCKVDVTVREHINKGRRKCVCELSTICKVAAVDI